MKATKKKKRIRFRDPNKVGTPYWICSACAKERGGRYFKTCSTASTLICGYCDGKKQDEDFIFPSRDYEWPSQRARKEKRKKAGGHEIISGN